MHDIILLISIHGKDQAFYVFLEISWYLSCFRPCWIAVVREKNAYNVLVVTYCSDLDAIPVWLISCLERMYLILKNYIPVLQSIFVFIYHDEFRSDCIILNALPHFLFYFTFLWLLDSEADGVCVSDSCHLWTIDPTSIQHTPVYGKWNFL